MKTEKPYLLLHNSMKFFMALLLLVMGFMTFNHTEAAAKHDRTPPTSPANLHAAGITNSAIILNWNKSTDNLGVSGYVVYQNNKMVGKTAANQYMLKNLSSGTTYSFYVRASDASGNLSASSKIIKATTSQAKPPSVSTIQVSPIASDGQTVSGTVVLSVSASAQKGISKVEFFSNNGGYLIKTVTAAPYRVNWATKNWVADGQQVLKVVVFDTSNHIAQVSRTVMVKNAVTPVQYQRIGYYTSWSTYSNFQVSNINVSMLTQLNYAFADISADGKIELGDPWADVEKPFPGDQPGQPFEGNFYQLTKLKQQDPALKTLISVGGWDGSGRFSDVALTDQSRTVFGVCCLGFILKYGFEGVDLDWESPVAGGKAGNVTRLQDKQDFTLLVQKIREVFNAQSSKDGKKYYLTIAGGVSKSYAANTELNLIQQYADYIQVMAYDIHGSWDTLTGLNAPLYRDPASAFHSEWSVQDAVQTYLNNGVPANKLIVGIPLYGRMYNQAAKLNNGLYQTFNGGGTALSYADIQANYLNKNGFIRYWDAKSFVPWLFNGTQFISYDDPESIGYKASYIKAIGLGGAMMWELSQDPNKVLLTTINNNLK